VLIIDDDAAFTLLAGETIQQAGFDVSIASNSREALAAFDACRPDLALLDVELPGSNGFDLCATLRAMSPGIDVPIVMVTGHDDTASIAQAYRVGATDSLIPPSSGARVILPSLLAGTTLDDHFKSRIRVLCRSLRVTGRRTGGVEIRYAQHPVLDARAAEPGLSHHREDL
jgi:CheY-like chemotaxis protein